MSKKKAFSGSTMSLKDFHGGSIPAEVHLPSGPGVIVERSSLDRTNSGGWIGPSINRGYGGERGSFTRQASGNVARTFEDKALYFPNSANIGRNYDEDERKPVDGHSRRGQSGESYEEQMYEQRRTGYDRPLDRHSLDNRGNYNSSAFLISQKDGYVHEGFGFIPLGPSSPKQQPQDYHLHSQATSTYALDVLLPYSPVLQEHPENYHPQPRSSGFHHVSQQLRDSGSPWRPNNVSAQQPTTSGTVMGFGSGVQNVWTARREGELNRSSSAEFDVNYSLGTGRAQAPASRIAHASAVEKVSSGRWNSGISQPAMEQPQEHTRQYIQQQCHSYEGGRGVITTEPAIGLLQGAYGMDTFSEVYKDNIRNGNSPHVITAYTETGRGVRAVSSRGIHSDVGQGDFPDSRREPYQEAGWKMFLGSSGDLVNSNTTYLGPGRVNISDPGLTRHTEGISGHSYGEIGRRASAGNREPARPAVCEGGMYAEPDCTAGLPSRFSGDEGSMYIEPGSSSQSNLGWTGVGTFSKGDYWDGRTGVFGDATRGSVPDAGRRGIVNVDHRKDAETDLTFYSWNDATERYLPEGRRSTHSEEGHGGYSYQDDGQQSHGHIPSRDYFRHEAPKGPYLSDVPKETFGNERNKAAFPVGFDRGLHMEGGRLQTSRGALSLTDDSGDARGGSEGGQSVSAFPLEVLSAGVPMNAAVDASAGSGAKENGEEINPLNERPKLNLKPRSQPIHVAVDSGSAKERNSVFGGARPREMVLKERGVDESGIIGVDYAPSPGAFIRSGLCPTSRGDWVNMAEVDYSVQKKDKADEKKLDGRHPEERESANTRQMERHSIGQLERNESRGRKEAWLDYDRKEDGRVNEKNDHRHFHEKRESDRLDVDKQDTWRRPVAADVGELSARVPGHLGASSAAELAQAFSRSTSLSSGAGAATQGSPSQRSLMPHSPGSGFEIALKASGSHGFCSKDVPFSRLTESLSPGPRDIYAYSGNRRTNGF